MARDKTTIRLKCIWSGMISRCHSQKSKLYPRYGGHGISVCDEWREFETFKSWALSHGYGQNLTIDRINSRGNYCPENCQWITLAENGGKHETNYILSVNGVVYGSAWSAARDLDVSYQCFCFHLRRGCDDLMMWLKGKGKDVVVSVIRKSSVSIWR